MIQTSQSISCLSERESPVFARCSWKAPMVLPDELRMVFRLWSRVYHHLLGVGLRLVVDGVTVVVDIRMESVVVCGVGDGLSPAVRKKHAVLSGHNVAV